jgi:hypothetical protein
LFDAAASFSVIKNKQADEAVIAPVAINSAPVRFVGHFDHLI